MAVLTKNIMTRVEISPSELAKLFCDMNCIDQAEFFNHVAVESKKWDGGNFDMQMQMVTDSNVNTEGRRIMKTIGDYSQPNK